LGLVVVLAIACRHGAGPAIELARTSEVPITKAVAVVETGDTVYAFEPHTVSIIRGGTVVARAEAPKHRAWTSAAVIPAPDGNGRWVVADLASSLWRVTPSGELEPVGDRFGIADDHVVNLAASSSTFGVGLTDGVAASTDGVHVIQLAGANTIPLAVARGRLARGDATAVHVFDLAHGTTMDYPFASGTKLAYVDADTESPRLAIANDSLVYVERHGKLERVAVPAPIASIAASGSRLWIVAGGSLYALDKDQLVTSSARVGTAAIFGSSSGDVWVASDKLRRYSASAGTTDPLWQTNVAPVFARVCSHCHAPGGSADLDLSTVATWRANRDEIVRRVLVTRTMPPAGTDLGDPERQALEDWLHPRN
jgi:hypothetical protein